MPEVHETTVAKIIENQPKPDAKIEPRPGVTVVTNENFNDYVTEQLGGKAAPEETPEANAAKELEKVESEKKERIAKDKKKPVVEEEIDHPDKEKKNKINERFSEITKARKEAEAKAAAFEATAKQEREAREAVEIEARRLKQTYEPPKSDELGPEPEPTQFTDLVEYSKAIKEWVADKTRREDAAKQAAETQKHERERLAKEWGERVTETVTEIPDYHEKLTAATVKISDQMRDAIVESEVGPKILYHFAENPDLAEKLGKLTVGKMLKELGKLEAQFIKTEKPKTEPKIEPKAQISRAPEPITPVGANGAAVTRLSGHQEVPRNWTYEDWKKARQAGQIN